MKTYDLSYPLSADDMVFPGTPPMEYKRSHTVEKDHYNLGLVSVNTHAGTHTDAPFHFVADGKTLEKVNLEKYVGKAFVVDCTSKQAFDSIDVVDAEPFAEEIRKCGRVIFQTGWSKKAGTGEYFTDYPVLTLELARWLAGLGIEMVGVEPPSLNPAQYIEVHKAFLEEDIAVVEGLTNLETLPSREIFFVGAPIALKGGDGFPIRAFALDLDN